MVLYSSEISLSSVQRLVLQVVQAQLVVLPSAHTCMDECIDLRDYQQNHNIADVVIMNLIIVSENGTCYRVPI